MKRLMLLLTLMLATLGSAWCQMADPVHFTTSLHRLQGDEAELVFSAAIDAGWHVYSTEVTAGPVAATLTVEKLSGAELVGKLRPGKGEQEHFDNMFNAVVRYFEHAATFTQRIRFTAPSYDIQGFLEYGACSDEVCLPPSTVEFSEHGKSGITEANAVEPVTVPTTAAAVAAASDSSLAVVSDSAVAASGVAPSDTASLAASPDVSSEPMGDKGLLAVFLAGLLGGLLAVLTPCVWPIIPMTVSFFLKRNQQRTTAIRETLLYALSIIVIYVTLGVVVTLIFGENALNAMATNAWFNIFFALLLIVFAISFFGAFELTLPSSWANSVDRKVDTLSTTSGGNASLRSMLSVFLMAFTLVLVSFSCTGPIIGLLLVSVATQGSLLAPTVGMLGFAVGLAVPFAFFSLFPMLMKQMPKSGGWMNTVKVTLAFVELAFALKFLSVADMAYGWRLLDREVFLAIWIALSALLTAYLLGWLRFRHDDADERSTSVVRLFMALASLAFTVYMIPGLWGAPLKAISAFTPPMWTQDFRPLSDSAVASDGSVGFVEARFRDFDEGMAAAKAEGKPVMLDFTGFGCVNCRKMEAAVWTDSRVARLLTRDYVLVSLYVDDKTSLPSPITVEMPNGKKRTLRSVGDKWSHLQASMFGANTQPYYVLLSPDGRRIAPPRSYDEDVEAYLEWLRQALDSI